MFHHHHHHAFQAPLDLQSQSQAQAAGYGAATPGLSLPAVGGQQHPYPAWGRLDSSLPHATGLPPDHYAPCVFSGSATFAQAGPASCPAAAEDSNSFAAQQPNVASISASACAHNGAAQLVSPVPPSLELEDILARAPLEPGSERSSQRRKRTVYTPEQLATLEEAFRKNMKPGIHQREELACITRISEDRLQVWFQNRRARYRKARKACSNPDVDVLGCNSHAKDGAPMDLQQAPLPVVWQQQYFIPPLAPAGSPCTPRAPYSAGGPSPDQEMAVGVGEHRPLQSHYTVLGTAQSAHV